MIRIESTHPRQGLSSFPHPVPADYTTPIEKEKGTWPQNIPKKIRGIPVILSGEDLTWRTPAGGPSRKPVNATGGNAIHPGKVMAIHPV